MYSTVLTLHSLVRWLVILLGVWAVVSAWRAPRAGGDRRAALPGLVFSMTLDIQLLIGLLLYVALSPITMAAIQNMAGAMKNGAWRFWTVEHPAMMVIAVVFAHLGRPRRGSADGGRHAVLWFGLALLALLVATPWPFMPQARPWIRW